MPKLPAQSDAKINLDKEFIDYINYLRTQHGLKALKLSEQVVLSGARDRKKYDALAQEFNVPLATIRQRGSALFKWMSSLWPGITVKKTDFRIVYPTLLGMAQDHFASNVKNPEVSGLVPSISEGFYGRSKELLHLENLLQYAGAIIILSGLHGVGRRALASRFLSQYETMLVNIETIWVHPSYSLNVVDQTYALLAIDSEQAFISFLKKKKHLFIFESGESFKDDDLGIAFLRTIQRLGSQAIVISTVPLSLPFATQFPLSGLATEDAVGILDEFELKERWWQEVLESLGGNPGFIRQYLGWATRSLGLQDKELILRSTIQFGIVSPFLENLFDSYSEEDLSFLRFIAQAEYRSLPDILMKYPTKALKLEELCRAGLVDARVLSLKGRVPKSGRKPVYMVPGVLKKYILDKNNHVSD